MPKNILMPISLDRVRSPISTLLRYVATHLSDYHFVAGSSPVDEADQRCADALWSQPHIESAGGLGMAASRFDIVHHASATSKNLLAAKLAKLRSGGKVRHVFTANCEPYPTDPYLKYVEKALRDADVVVAVSEAVAKGVKAFCEREVDRVIPNGFDDHFYTLAPADETAGQAPYFLFCSQILDRKHPEVFLDLAEQMPECQFIMVGNNPYPESDLAKKVLSRVNALNNVEYQGLKSREELRHLMQHAAALLHPSDYEGLPLTVVEAMGCGCPVIAQPKSSLPEVIEHDENGWLYLNEDSASWLAKMTELTAMSSDRRRQGAAHIRDSVVGKFSWATIAESYRSLYDELSQPGENG